MQAVDQSRYCAVINGLAEPEPDFDEDRVIWDETYRHQVIDALRLWRSRQQSDTDAVRPSQQAA